MAEIVRIALKMPNAFPGCFQEHCDSLTINALQMS
jgi:hypothetical protein